ncbi:MAG: hypothetical protein IH622_22500 [Ochrobactrum anthropi]|uniref:Uncharacterized protein n=1 Tax=Brucella anthropi TaxID=529 RepID=A0A8I0TCU0_BRUAN|nr:hypothetical protein [Brucella anthropi]MBE0563566.1 hypothetical protein [Brucella anthropi]
MMLPNTMIEVARAGGGLDIDCSKTILLPETMVQIAQAAAFSGKKPTIVFRNISILLPDTAKAVARAGDGCVIFAI